MFHKHNMGLLEQPISVFCSIKFYIHIDYTSLLIECGNNIDFCLELGAQVPEQYAGSYT